MVVAEVYLNQTNKRIDHAYDYGVPPELDGQVVPGVRVMVPFGRGKRQLEGFVVRLKMESAFPEKLRPIHGLIDRYPVLTEVQIQLCLHMKTRYCSLFYEALSYFVNPVRVVKKKGEEDKQQILEAYSKTEKCYRLLKKLDRPGRVQKQVIDLLSLKDCTRKELMAVSGDVSSVLRTLESRGIIESYDLESFLPDSSNPAHVVKTVPPEMGGSLYRQYLRTNGALSWQYLEMDSKTDGETDGEIVGSTMPVAVFESDFKKRCDFYLCLIRDTLEAGKSAVLMLPDIAWSSTMEQVFYAYFGDAVALCHGRQRQMERYTVYKRVQNGAARVVIGTRAALFLPYKELGLIIVDEEQDPSYYAIGMPRYNTIDLAETYARMTGALLVASDELPSVALRYKVERRQYRGLGDYQAPLLNRLPVVVNLQQEMKSGHYDFMSRVLKEKLEAVLKRGERAALLLNKRGYASYVFCRSCGHVEKCPSCQVALKSYNGILKCHHCGYTRPEPSSCPSCGSTKMKALGMGIDQAYEVLKKRYPEADILKIDSTTICDEQDLRAVQRRLKETAPDILLGTRMLMRFPDLGNISLGAALLIDSDLYHGDYRSSEETWQLYGRFFKRVQGEGIIQTYESNHPAVQALAGGDVEAFYQNELAYRKLLKYPPVQHIVMISLFHTNKQEVAREALRLFQHLKRAGRGCKTIHLFDPFQSGVILKTGQIRWKIMIRTECLEDFNRVIDQVIQESGIEDLISRVSIEIDPLSTL